MAERLTGDILNRRWNVGAQHALYHREGTWYHYLTRFPGALFDYNGYVVFRMPREYEECTYLDFGEDVHVPNGIASMPGYVTKRSPLPK